MNRREKPCGEWQKSLRIREIENETSGMGENNHL
jgi:hypothetical protein